jgi:hypothetical protein
LSSPIASRLLLEQALPEFIKLQTHVRPDILLILNAAISSAKPTQSSNVLQLPEIVESAKQPRRMRYNNKIVQHKHVDSNDYSDNRL